MYPGGPNPTKLQSAPPGSRKTPLVLVHDGSGTTFGYFFIGNLDRDVWGIHDPNYWEGKLEEGGLNEMARKYITLIRNAGIRGKILLGGWSLGGLLSVTMSRILADDPAPTFSVEGIAIIDSPRHIPIQSLKEPLMDPDLGDLPELVQKAFKNCDKYLDTWELPTWTGPTKGGKTLTVSLGGKNYDLENGKKLHQPLDGKVVVREDTKKYEFKETSETPLGPPPAVMIRATKPTDKPKDVDHPCTIDIFRERPLLGWEGDYPDFIQASLDIESAHFDLFDKVDEKKLDQLTKLVNQSLEILDSIVESGQ